MFLNISPKHCIPTLIPTLFKQKLFQNIVVQRDIKIRKKKYHMISDITMLLNIVVNGI